VIEGWSLVISDWSLVIGNWKLEIGHLDFYFVRAMELYGWFIVVEISFSSISQ